MKIWKPFLMACMALAACVSFTSCEKDGDEVSNTSIVGTWKIISGTYGSLLQMTESDLYTFSFKSNGSDGMLSYFDSKTLVSTSLAFEYMYSEATSTLTIKRLGEGLFIIDGIWDVSKTKNRMTLTNKEFTSWKIELAK